MIIFLVLLIGISIYDIRRLIKEGKLRDIVFYVAFTVLVGVMGIIYFISPYQQSVSDYILDIVLKKG